MHADLLTQAEVLVTLDPGRPKQANVRRAVSSTYYGLFHFLVDQSCQCAMGRGHLQQAYRRVVGRAFDHAAMKIACASFSGGVLKKGVAESLPTSFRIDDPTRRIAELFVDLQERRHIADYDLSRQFERTEALLLIERTRKAIDDFLPSTPTTARSSFSPASGRTPGLPVEVDALSRRGVTTAGVLRFTIITAQVAARCVAGQSQRLVPKTQPKVQAMNEPSKTTPRTTPQLTPVGSESLAQIDGGKCKVASDGYLIPDCMLSKGQLAYRNAVRANLANGHH